MTTARRPEPEVRERPIVRPVMRNGRPFWPRCGSGLQRDYEGLTCIACGYEFVAPADEPEWRRALRRRPAVALWPFLLGARINPYLAAAGLLILASPPLLAWTRRVWNRTRAGGTNSATSARRRGRSVRAGP